MKASYILALIAAFAVSSISASIENSKLQNQEQNGNNAKIATSDGNLVGVPGLAQDGVKVASSEENVFHGSQNARQ